MIPVEGFTYRPPDDNGRSLIVTSIGGQNSRAQAEGFIKNLRRVGDTSEILGVSLFDSSPGKSTGIEQLLAPSPSGGLNFLRNLPGRDKPVRTPVFVSQDPQTALTTLMEHSTNLDDTVRAVFHFIAYGQGNGGLIRDTLEPIKETLPNLLHLGIIIAPIYSGAEKYWFDEEVTVHRPEDLGVPIILLDQVSPLEASRQESARQRRSHREKPLARHEDTIPTDEAFLIDLAGLVANGRMLPRLNPSDYISLLSSLIHQSRLIGVSISQSNKPTLYINQQPHLQEDFQNAANQTLRVVFDDSNSYTSVPRNEEASLDVAVVQIPLPRDHPLWKKPDLVFDPRFSTYSLANPTYPTRFTISAGSFKAQPIEFGTKSLREKVVPIPATRFYPAAVTPSWQREISDVLQKF